MIYKKKYINSNNDYIIIQIYPDGFEREVDELRPAYQEWILTNTLEEIQYILPIILLEELKIQKQLEIFNAHENYLSLGCPIMLPSNVYFVIDCMPKNQGDFSNMLLAMQIFGLQSTTVGDFNNETHEVTFDEYKLMCGQLLQHVQAGMLKKWYLRDLIDHATTIEEVELISW